MRDDDLTPRLRSVAAAYDELAPTYDDAYSDPASEAENRAIAFLLRNTTPPYLDAGCGTGLLLDLLPQPVHPITYLGFDISPGMLGVAERKHPGYSFREYAIEDLDLPRTFNTVVSLFGPLSYCHSLTSSIERLTMALRPGGWLFAMVCAERHIRRENYSAGKLTCPPPLRRYYSANLIDAADAVGLERVSVTGFSGGPERWPLPVRLRAIALVTHHATVGLAAPDTCDYLILHGQRPTSATSYANRHHGPSERKERYV